MFTQQNNTERGLTQTCQGHPSDLPVQLDLVPPALSRKLAEKMRKEGSGSQPPDAQMPTLLAPDFSQSYFNGQLA
jgi:hypothetical protein